jgi:hypothetical protein
MIFIAGDFIVILSFSVSLGTGSAKDPYDETFEVVET